MVALALALALMAAPQGHGPTRYVVLRAGTALFARPTRGGSGLALPTADRAAEAPGFVAELLEERGDVVRVRSVDADPIARWPHCAAPWGAGAVYEGWVGRDDLASVTTRKLAHTDPDGTALELPAGTPAAVDADLGATTFEAASGQRVRARGVTAAVGASYALDPLPAWRRRLQPGLPPVDGDRVTLLGNVDVWRSQFSAFASRGFFQRRADWFEVVESGCARATLRIGLAPPRPPTATPSIAPPLAPPAAAGRSRVYLVRDAALSLPEDRGTVIGHAVALGGWAVPTPDAERVCLQVPLTSAIGAPARTTVCARAGDVDRDYVPNGVDGPLSP